MARRVDVDQLVGAKEIAARLQVRGKSAVHDWRRRHDDFPIPIAQVSGVHIWLWPEVEAWARKTGRL
jgi:hypothetical protein